MTYIINKDYYFLKNKKLSKISYKSNPNYHGGNKLKKKSSKFIFNEELKVLLFIEGKKRKIKDYDSEVVATWPLAPTWHHSIKCVFSLTFRADLFGRREGRMDLTIIFKILHVFLSN